jgi:chemotaxis protein CheX
MQAVYINPFLTTISMVLRQVVPDIQIDRGPLAKTTTPIQTSGCSTIISMTGSASGRVILDMPKGVAIAIAQAFHQERIPEFNELVASTVNEIANMICGGAITQLNGQGFDIEISPPTLFLGEKIELFDAANISEGIAIPIHTNHGDFFLNVAISSGSS